MKKKIIIITVAGLLLIVGTISIILTVSNNNELKVKTPIQTSKYNVFGKQYNSLKEVPSLEIYKHFSFATRFLGGKTYKTFGDEEIAMLVASKYLNLDYKDVTEETIQEFVENNFGIKNYELEAKMYDMPNYGTFIISENENKYNFNIPFEPSRLASGYFNFYKEMSFMVNRIIIHYNFGYHSGAITNELVFIGATDVYLKYNGENLMLEQILYNELDFEIHEKILQDNIKIE